MAVLELEEAGRRRTSGGAPTSTTASRAPAVAQNGRAGATSQNPDEGDRARIRGYMLELDDIYALLPQFPTYEPDQVLLLISGWLARMTGIRADLQRSGTTRANTLRTKEVDPLIEALDQQFKIHSRLIAMRELDFKVSGAQV